MNRDNVLVLEDDGSALAFIEILQEFDGFEVYKTVSWKSAEYWLRYEPGEDSFAAVVLDLNMPAYELGTYGNKPYNKDSHFSPSLYFIDNFIQTQTKLLDRVILYSAYLEQLTKKGYNTNRLHIINKIEAGSVKRLIDKVNALRGK